MRIRALPTLLVLTCFSIATACSDDGTTPPVDDCPNVVVVDGIAFEIAQNLQVPGDYNPQVTFATVERLVLDCEDVSELEELESTFLPAGSRLHEIPQFAPTERLAVRYQLTWLVLVPR